MTTTPSVIFERQLYAGADLGFGSNCDGRRSDRVRPLRSVSAAAEFASKRPFKTDPLDPASAQSLPPHKVIAVR